MPTRSPILRISLFLSSGLGVGYIPWGSGTFGTLWGFLLYYLGRNLSLPFLILGTVLFLIFSLLVSHYAEKSLDSHDSSIIVIDEVVGYLVAVVGIPFTFYHAAGAFLLFRLFDIWKPYPICLIDKKGKGAIGVVMDDVLAGVFANLILRVILNFVK